MAKFTDAVRATLTGYFNAGDQPTEAQFTALILAIQEGIEEHDHDDTGDGDGKADLGITSITGAGVDVPDGWYLGIGAALERLVFDDAGDISIQGANFGVNAPAPIALFEVRDADQTIALINESTGTNGDTAELLFQSSSGADLIAKAGIIFIKTGANSTGTLHLVNRTTADVAVATAADAKVSILTTGLVGFSEPAPEAQVHITQPIADAAIPVLDLEQLDVDQAMMKLKCTIGIGNGLETVGGKTLTTTHFVKVILPGPLTRYIPCGTIA